VASLIVAIIQDGHDGNPAGMEDTVVEFPRIWRHSRKPHEDGNLIFPDYHGSVALFVFLWGGAVVYC